jgi:hypothetical protein|tara:strand:+ start:729 stop:872 length:144 start_codon:yes stop_codon:yes gene_type:complete
MIEHPKQFSESSSSELFTVSGDDQRFVRLRSAEKFPAFAPPPLEALC